MMFIVWPGNSLSLVLRTALAGMILVSATRLQAKGPADEGNPTNPLHSILHNSDEATKRDAVDTNQERSDHHGQDAVAVDAGAEPSMKSASSTPPAELAPPTNRPLLPSIRPDQERRLPGAVGIENPIRAFEPYVEITDDEASNDEVTDDEVTNDEVTDDEVTNGKKSGDAGTNLLDESQGDVPAATDVGTLAVVTDRPIYADTISGTLVVVADEPIQHYAECRQQGTCVGRSLCGCQDGSTCGHTVHHSILGGHGRQLGPAPMCPTCRRDPWYADGLARGWLLGDSFLGFTVGGWLAQSFTANGDDPQNGFNGPVTFVDRANQYQLNQAYLYFERRTNTEFRRFDLGGRVDLLYGTDARFTLTDGLDARIVSDAASRFYKMSIPQLYAEFALDNLAVQMGRFYTILGYESVMAPDNFFISHSYSMQYGEPKTNTGMLARYGGPRGVTVLGGFTRGWDNWEDTNNNLDVMAGLNWTSADERRSVSAAVASGPQDDLGLDYRTLTSVILQQAIGSNVNYVFHCDVGFENNGAGGGQDAEWYGFVNYLTLDINDCWSLGARQEWFSDDDGVRVVGLGTPRGVDISPTPSHWQELTFGVNYRPRENWVVRSESRWDWSNTLVPAATGPFDDGNRWSQFTWSIDLIIGF